jgi:diguanylate cyclase (GGDEF)-like protein
MKFYNNTLIFFKTVPLRLWLIAIVLFLIPIFIDTANGDFESIWFIYIFPAFIFSYYYGIKGGIFSAFIGLFIHGIWEMNQSFFETYNDENYYTVFFSTILCFSVAVGTGYLVDKLNQKQSLLEMISLNDELTNLWNRRGFFTFSQKELEFAKAHYETGAILFVDLDRFKLVNDLYGHHIGDLLLQTVAQRLKTCTRAKDILSRIGGDEFAFMLINVNSSTAKIICSRIIEKFTKPFNIEGIEIYITPSIGVSLYPADGENIDSLLQQADNAMYTVKKSGKNGFQFYAEIDDQSNKIAKMEVDLRKAIESNQFILLYQPQLDLNTGEICGVEALIRWNSPNEGLVSPVDFIPVAEDTNQIIPIGEWVLRTACRQNKEWQNKGYKPICISVNISICQFNHPDFINVVQKALFDSELDPQYLKLEMTESLLLGNKKENIEKLEKLKKLGIKISLDDFGSGYSSFSYIRYLPLDELKMDKSFIRQVPNESKDNAIIKTIINLAHSLDVRVVCEGIEKKEQVEFLKQTDCHVMQGYYLSVPLECEEFEKLQEHPSFIS